MLTGHEKQWNFLKKKFESNQLAHAYLFSGEEKLGKKTLAKEFVKLISCTNAIQKPCGLCRNCKDIENENYIDLLIVNLKTDKQEIEISQAREALNFLSYKSYHGSFKAVIIDGAETMNSETQSCFLKTLEEPKGKTILILISSRPEMLLGTILSRCQTIKFFPFKKYEISPQEQQTLQELLNIINSDLATKFQYVKQINLDGNNFKKILEILQRYFRYLLFSKLGIEKLISENNYSISKIKEVLKLLETINIQTSLTNASPKLALEILLMEM
ncbi:MAG: DNA polymerase III subunit [Candidatus Staskawiczbacteria bacterium]|nr:DNA polymerase III subunit [Candidatus Staskawiczbacteria bacterium]